MAQVIKQNKLAYYFRSVLIKYSGTNGFREKIAELQKRLSAEQTAAAEERIAYYNKLDDHHSFRCPTKIQDLKFPKTPKAATPDIFCFLIATL